MLEPNASSFTLCIDQSICQSSLHEQANLSPDFIYLLSLLANKNFEGPDGDAQLFLALPVIEELSRRLFFQYHTEFHNKADPSQFSPVQAAIENDLIHAVKFLQLFSNGRYHLSELQNAMRYLEPHKYTCGEKTCGENILDSTNRLRAFGSRAWRVMNPLLSLAVTDVDFLKAVTRSFLYLAWIFPFVRLSLATGVVAKHIFSPEELTRKFDVQMRFKAQIRRYRYLVLHDTAWFLARLLGCFVWPQALTQVSLGLFAFGLAESCVLRKRAVAANERKMLALSLEEGCNPLILNFFQLSYQNGAAEMRNNHNFKVRIMGFYVGSLAISLISHLFLPRDRPSAQFSCAWIGSLLGSFLILVTCVFQMAYSGNDKQLLPAGTRKKLEDSGESQTLLPPNGFH
ncbi:MAG: hypothetical protein Q8L78_00635 [Coxiellaceae bacterium]|nr:hypothetical protein [Coxiellaceae bacterium]